MKDHLEKAIAALRLKSPQEPADLAAIIGLEPRLLINMVDENPDIFGTTYNNTGRIQLKEATYRVPVDRFPPVPLPKP